MTAQVHTRSHGCVRLCVALMAAAVAGASAADRHDVTIYNPLAANRHTRLEDIAREIGGSVIVLVGTRQRCTVDAEQFEYRSVNGYHAVQFGYTRGSNKHAGMTIMLAKKHYAKQNIVRVITPGTDRRLRGRVGGVRLKTASSDITVIGAYYPPPHTQETKRLWHEVNDKVSQMIAQIPGRSVPLLLCDSNCHVGSVKGDDDGTVGMHDCEREDEAGMHFREMLQAHEMALYNTFFPCGKTFFSTTGGRSTRVDYIAGPRSLITDGRVLRCRVRLYAGDRLQIIKCCRRADHRPVTARLAAKLTYHGMSSGTQWDWDALVEAAAYGSEKGRVFQATVEQAMTDTAAQWEEVERSGPSDQWAYIQAVCKDACDKVFSKKARDAEVCAKHRYELLRTRAKVRQRFVSLNASKPKRGEIDMRAILRIWLMTAKIDRCAKGIARRVKAEKNAILELRRRELNDAWRRRNLAETWRVMRLLAGVGRKKRRLGVMQDVQPNVVEWRMFYALPGGEGGVDGYETTKEQQAESYGLDFPVKSHDANEEWLAESDLRETAEALRKAKCRRAVAPGDLPAEAWRILLCNSSVRKEGHLGLDYNRERGAPPPSRYRSHTEVHKKLRNMISTSRASKCLPWQWHHVHAWLIPKPGKTIARDRCRGIRTVYGVVSLCKAYMRGLWRNSKRQSTLSMHEDDVELICQHFERGFFTLDVPNHGELTMRPCSGVFPGSSVAVELFSGAWWRQLDEWTQRHDAENERLLCVKSIVTGRSVSTAMTSFVDDVARKIIGRDSRELIQRDGDAASSLSAYAGEAGIAMNESKAVVQMMVSGGGSRQQMKDLYGDGGAHLSVGCKKEARYLGPYLNLQNNASDEIRRRLRAMEVAYHTFRKFWHTRHIDFPFRVVAFRCIMSMTAFSGLTAFALTTTQTERLESALCKYARRVMQGAACKRDEDDNVMYTLSNREVLCHFGLARVDVELACLRMKQLQSIVRHAEEHEVFLNAMFARFPFEIKEYEHPWLVQMQRDFQMFSHIDTVTWVAEEVMMRASSVVTDEHVREAFLQVDFAYVKAHFMQIQFPPPGTQTALLSKVRVRGCDEGGFVCEDTCENGEICGQRFNSLKALRKHQTSSRSKGGSHSLHNVVELILTNQCIFCRSAFATRDAAKRHLRHAMMCGACNTDQGYLNSRVEAVENPTCRVCGLTFPSLTEYYLHVTQHVRPPEHIVLHHKREREPADVLKTSAKNSTYCRVDRLLRDSDGHVDGQRRADAPVSIWKSAQLAEGLGRRRDRDNDHGGVGSFVQRPRTGTATNRVDGGRSPRRKNSQAASWKREWRPRTGQHSERTARKAAYRRQVRQERKEREEGGQGEQEGQGRARGSRGQSRQVGTRLSDAEPRAPRHQHGRVDSAQRLRAGGGGKGDNKGIFRVEQGRPEGCRPTLPDGVGYDAGKAAGKGRKPGRGRQRSQGAQGDHPELQGDHQRDQRRRAAPPRHRSGDALLPVQPNVQEGDGEARSRVPRRHSSGHNDANGGALHPEALQGRSQGGASSGQRTRARSSTAARIVQLRAESVMVRPKGPAKSVDRTDNTADAEAVAEVAMREAGSDASRPILFIRSEEA
eukprot:TRINITY_DN1955_c0_g1_i1.p1 TRINITY_DN1955_c0_g1~~TRINITY_DN1955_c0_g1_i1.p1  ORF type:complete len:1600 (+),score=138.99 TRINITY_DN1955_c0_g1_i1:125-4924(+)